MLPDVGRAYGSGRISKRQPGAGFTVEACLPFRRDVHGQHALELTTSLTGDTTEESVQQRRLRHSSGDSAYAWVLAQASTGAEGKMAHPVEGTPHERMRPSQETDRLFPGVTRDLSPSDRPA